MTLGLPEDLYVSDGEEERAPWLRSVGTNEKNEEEEEQEEEEGEEKEKDEGGEEDAENVEADKKGGSEGDTK